MNKQTEKKKFLRNVRIIGALFALIAIAYVVLLEFNLLAIIFGLFFFSIGVAAMIYPRAVKTFLQSLVDSL